MIFSAMGYRDLVGELKWLLHLCHLFFVLVLVLLISLGPCWACNIHTRSPWPDVWSCKRLHDIFEKQNFAMGDWPPKANRSKLYLTIFSPKRISASSSKILASLHKISSRSFSMFWSCGRAKILCFLNVLGHLETFWSNL